MKRIQNSEFRVQKLLMVFAISLCTLHFALCTSTAKAVDSTPSSSIVSKLDALKKQIASKAAELKKEIGKKLENKAFVGKTKVVTDKAITISVDKEDRQIAINQDTVFTDASTSATVKTKPKQKFVFSIDTLKADDYIAGLGEMDDTGALIAKKVVLIPPPDKKISVWGQVSAINDEQIILKDRDGKNWTVEDNKDTDYKGDPAVNDFVIVSGFLNEKDTLEASLVFVAEDGVLKSTPKTATSSASPSATPSATISPKITAPAPRSSSVVGSPSAKPKK